MQTHDQSQYHKDAAARAQAFVSTIENPEKHHMSQQASELYQNNLYILFIIVRAIIFCGRQSIALRGHQDDHTSDAVQGNFIALLNFLAEFDETLNHHLQFGKKIIATLQKQFRTNC